MRVVRQEHRKSSERKSFILHGVCLAAAVSGCFNAASAVARPPEWKPQGEAKCHARSGQQEPLVVEWPSADRAKMEALTRQGIVAMRYIGCETQVLGSCIASGRYRYTPTGHKKDRVRIQNEDDLYARLPFGAASLEGTLKSSGELNVSMTIVGRYEADHAVRLPELRGQCDRATHFVSALIVGAFEFSSGAQSQLGGGVSVFSAGAGSQGLFRRSVLTADGNARECEKPDTPQGPPEQCGALIRLELSPIPEIAGRIEREERAARDKYEEQKSAASARRTVGWGLTGVGLASAATAGAMAYLGSRGNEKVKDGELATASEITNTIDRGQKFNILFWVFGGVSVPLLGVGMPLVILNPASPGAPEPGLVGSSVRPMVQLAGALP